jgi:multiple sugar transport system permease protein
LAMRMAPGIAIVLPVYLLYQQVGLVNTLSGLVLLYTTFNLPFITWLLRTFVATIPVEIEESAMCDGCSRAAAFWRVTLPLMAPGVAVSSVFAFMLAWNEFLFAYILSGRSTRTITVAMSLFQSEEGIYWGQMMAAATLVAVPILIFALSVQKYMLSGLTLGAVKA